jgi:hypothetical protein
MKSLFVLFIVGLFSTLFAQSEPANYNLSSGEAIATDTTGNIYVAGSIVVNLVFGPGRSEDVFIAKYDSAGNQLSYKQFGIEDIESVGDIAIAESGDVFVSGLNIRDANSPLSGPYSFFLTKFGAEGEVLWEKHNDKHSYSRVKLDSVHNIFVGGYDASVGQAIVMKMDADGQELWFQHLTINEYTSIGNIAVDAKDNVLVAGSSGPDKQLSNNREIDCYVTKLDKDGQILWMKSFGGDNYDSVGNIIVDNSGNSFIIGDTMSSSIAGDTDVSLFMTSNDAFLASFDPDGNKRWSNQFGFGRGYSGNAITLDNQGNAVLVGFGNGDLGGERIGASDVFIVKYQPEGTQLWIKRFGTEEFDGANSVTTDSKGFIYLTGYLGEIWDDLTLNSYLDNYAGQYTFLAKYTPEGQQVWLKTFENRAATK